MAGRKEQKKLSKLMLWKLSLFIRLAVIKSEKVDKGVPVHAMEAYMGNRGMAPLILNLSSRWR